MKRTFFLAVAMLFTVLSFAGCGGGGESGGGGDDPADSTFTNGTGTLSTSTTTSESAKTTTVHDANGNLILTSTLTVNGVSLAFPSQAQTADTTFSEALPNLPTNFAANVLAAYIAGQVSGISTSISNSSSVCLTKDSPGCDWFPDTQCTLGCCADHDYCYDLNGCSAASWLIVGQSSECINCNGIAEICISRACANVDESRSTDRCYDNRCHQFYDCDEADCYTCTSPCDTVSPRACTSAILEDCCGNGTCEVDESVDNCPADCRDGAGVNQCCSTKGDCPSELAHSCPDANCCCCGDGEVCAQDGSHLCTASSRDISKRADYGIPIPEEWKNIPKSERK